MRINEISFKSYKSQMKNNVVLNVSSCKDFSYHPKTALFESLPPFFLRPDKGEFKKNLNGFFTEFKKTAGLVSDIQTCKYTPSMSAYNNDDDDYQWKEYRQMKEKDEKKILRESLDKLLKKYKFIDETTKVNVEVECEKVSAYGRGYKISFENKNAKTDTLFLKIYYNNCRENSLHGPYPEIARSVFINKNMSSKKNFPTYYSGSYKGNTYFFSEYIPENVVNKSMQYPHCILGLKFEDHSLSHNMRGDFYIDPGGISQANSLAYNKVARNIAKRVFRHPEKSKTHYWDRLFVECPKHNSSQIAGLVYSIRYLPKPEQKERFERILDSKYKDSNEVMKAILCEHQLCDLVFDKKQKHDFLRQQLDSLKKRNSLNQKERNYLIRVFFGTGFSYNF